MEKKIKSKLIWKIYKMTPGYLWYRTIFTEEDLTNSYGFRATLMTNVFLLSLFILQTMIMLFDDEAAIIFSVVIISLVYIFIFLYI